MGTPLWVLYAGVDDLLKVTPSRTCNFFELEITICVRDHP